MIVFLDFDGVLHPLLERFVNPFCNLARLEAVLRAAPVARIVISSNQREERSFDSLRAVFAPDIADRIIGITPLLPIRNAEDISGSRYREILSYLAAHPTNAWMALDDDKALFPAGCPNLLLCEDGFDQTAATKLSDRLAPGWRIA